MSSTTFPKYVYKILPEAPPSPTPHTLPLSSLDAKDGFIHLSDAHQVSITADLFFGSSTKLWILKISSLAVKEEGTDAELRWADGLPGCVHLHGKDARLGTGIVIEVRSYDKSTIGKNWKEAFEMLDFSGWLVDG